MFGSTYAVMWDGTNGTRCAGRVALDGASVIFSGGSNGSDRTEWISFREIEEVSVYRGRLRLMRRDAPSLWIRSLDAPGALRELAERIALAVG